MDSKFTHRLSWNYLLALGLIALLSVCAHLLLYHTISTQKNSASLINISGRQRMLLQRTALYSLRLTESLPKAREDLRKELTISAELLDKTHCELLRSAKIQDFLGLSLISSHDIFFDKSTQLDTRLRSYLQDVKKLSTRTDQELSANPPELQSILDAAAYDLLEALNIAVIQYQKASEAAIEQLQWLDTIILVIILATLLLIALFIFRPMVLQIHQDRRQLEEANYSLQLISQSDGLTGLANRRCLDEFLAVEWKKAEMSYHELAVILIDIDCFKSYNDTYGHLAGDECLRRVAQTLKNTLKRPEDLAARYGGEEFLVVLPGSRLTGARHVAEKLRAAVQDLHIPHIHSAAGAQVTISLGVAVTIPTPGSSPEQLVSKADQALYHAKNNGRNCVSIAP